MASIAALKAEIREATRHANGRQATAVRRVQARHHSDKNGDMATFQLIPEALAQVQLEDDAGNPNEQLQESSKLMVGFGDYAAEKEARKEERRRKFAEEQERHARKRAKTAAITAPAVAQPASNETPSVTESEVYAVDVTSSVDQEGAARTPDTSLPPNTAVLDIFNGIVCDLGNNNLKVPLNGDREYSHRTLQRNVAPIRSLLENKFSGVPVQSNETDLVHILDEVASRADIPKTDAQLKKLPTAAKWFLKVLRSNMCDGPPVVSEETNESDVVPCEETVALSPDAPTVDSALSGGKTSSKKMCNFFDAMWERVLPDIIPDCRTSIRDYVRAAKRCTSGKESNFPLVNTIEDLITVCDSLMKGSNGYIESKQCRRIRKVIVAVTDHVECVGFDAARDYFLQNGAETAHPVSCA